jgi:2-polyprenyl-3-methyl-5-hydroxy-6-metoxy-1,4-benzoquinol methylase
MITLPRSAGAELMDRPDADPEELARSLEDLRSVNRWLGGTRAVRHHLSRLCAAHPQAEYSILDVATGSADFPVALVGWARRAGLGLRVVATDLHPATLSEARRRTADIPEVEVQAADALHLPFDDGAFDVTLLSTALHHFDHRADAVMVLREMARVSRIGIIVNDLRRSLPALIGARLLAATVWRRHPITRHDGPLSVRRAYSAGELRELADAAGLAGARVHRHVPFRLVLVTGP